MSYKVAGNVGDMGGTTGKNPAQAATVRDAKKKAGQHHPKYEAAYNVKGSAALKGLGKAINK